MDDRQESDESQEATVERVDIVGDVRVTSFEDALSTDLGDDGLEKRTRRKERLAWSVCVVAESDGDVVDAWVELPGQPNFEGKTRSAEKWLEAYVMSRPSILDEKPQYKLERVVYESVRPRVSVVMGFE